VPVTRAGRKKDEIEKKKRKRPEGQPFTGPPFGKQRRVFKEKEEQGKAGDDEKGIIQLSSLVREEGRGKFGKKKREKKNAARFASY